jgi:hypothetical protein
MTWSLSANGIADTVEDAEKIFGEFREFLADHSYKTLFSSFSGQGISETSFHASGPVTPETPAQEPEEGQEPPAQETPAGPPGEGAAEEEQPAAPAVPAPTE